LDEFNFLLRSTDDDELDDAAAGWGTNTFGADDDTDIFNDALDAELNAAGGCGVILTVDDGVAILVIELDDELDAAADTGLADVGIVDDELDAPVNTDVIFDSLGRVSRFNAVVGELEAGEFCDELDTSGRDRVNLIPAHATSEYDNFDWVATAERLNPSVEDDDWSSMTIADSARSVVFGFLCGCFFQHSDSLCPFISQKSQCLRFLFRFPFRLLRDRESTLADIAEPLDESDTLLTYSLS
jgi:hypothetical protein